MSFTPKRSFEIQNIKQPLGLLSCVAALFFIISCSSSHRTTAHSGYNSHVHLGHSTPIAYTSDHGSIEVLALKAIIIAAVLVVPPIIDAVGELLDDVFVAIGLKEREPISDRYLTAPTNRD